MFHKILLPFHQILHQVQHFQGLLQGHGFLSVLKGKMEMYLNDTEKHVLVPGDILNFDGVNFIKGTALEDSEFNVTLIKK